MGRNRAPPKVVVVVLAAFALTAGVWGWNARQELVIHYEAAITAPDGGLVYVHLPGPPSAPEVVQGNATTRIVETDFGNAVEVFGNGSIGLSWEGRARGHAWFAPIDRARTVPGTCEDGRLEKCWVDVRSDGPIVLSVVWVADLREGGAGGGIVSELHHERVARSPRGWFPQEFESVVHGDGFAVGALLSNVAVLLLDVVVAAWALAVGARRFMRRYRASRRG